jgi:nicotinate phosphoribosyltransferase
MLDGVAAAEVVVTGDEPAWDANHRPLLSKVVDQGVIDPAHTGPSAVTAAAARHHQAVGELPPTARRLQDGEPAIPTEFELH